MGDIKMLIRKLLKNYLIIVVSLVTSLLAASDLNNSDLALDGDLSPTHVYQPYPSNPAQELLENGEFSTTGYMVFQTVITPVPVETIDQTLRERGIAWGCFTALGISGLVWGQIYLPGTTEHIVYNVAGGVFTTLSMFCFIGLLEAWVEKSNLNNEDSNRRM